MRKNKEIHKRGPKPKITDNQIKKAHAAGMDHVEIARAFNVSLQTARRRFKDLGLKVKDTRGRKDKGRVIKVFTIRPEAKEKIDIIAQKTGAQKGEVVERAIDLYFNQLNP